MDYTKGTIELLTVAGEICRYLEQTTEKDIEKSDFVSKTVKLLPLLYLKTALMPTPKHKDIALETFVTENAYNELRAKLVELFNNDDGYLNAQHPDMAVSDTPVLSYLSENLADIYQRLRDFVGQCQMGDTDMMNEALAVLTKDFRISWGATLLDALRALHRIYTEKTDNASTERH